MDQRIVFGSLRVEGHALAPVDAWHFRLCASGFSAEEVVEIKAVFMGLDVKPEQSRVVLESLGRNTALRPQCQLDGDRVRLTLPALQGFAHGRILLTRGPWTLSVDFEAEIQPFRFELRARDPTSLAWGDSVTTALRAGSPFKVMLRALCSAICLPRDVAMQVDVCKNLELEEMRVAKALSGQELELELTGRIGAIGSASTQVVVTIRGLTKRLNFSAIVVGPRVIRAGSTRGFVFEPYPIPTVGCHAAGVWAPLDAGEARVETEARPVVVISRLHIDALDCGQAGASARITSFAPVTVSGGLVLTYLVLRTSTRSRSKLILTISDAADGEGVIAVRHADAIVPATDRFMDAPLSVSHVTTSDQAKALLLQVMRILAPGLTAGSLSSASSVLMKSDCLVPRGSLAVIAALISQKEVVMGDGLQAFSDLSKLFSPLAAAESSQRVIVACRVLAELHNNLATLFQGLKARNFYVHLPFTWTRLEKAQSEHFPGAAAGSGPTVESERLFKGEEAVAGSRSWLVDRAGSAKEISEPAIAVLWSELSAALEDEHSDPEESLEPEQVQAALQLPRFRRYETVSGVLEAFSSLTRLAQTLPAVIAAIRRGHAELQPAERVFRVLARVYKADLSHGLVMPVFAEFCRAFEGCCSLLHQGGVSFTTGDWLEQVVSSFSLGLDAVAAGRASPAERVSRWVIGAKSAEAAPE